MAGIRIGIDTGGTFTDVVALDEDTGRIVTTKTPSTPRDPATGFLTAVAKILDLWGDAEFPDSGPSSPVRGITHGTTVATNLLLEDAVDRIALITTAGYEFLLEIARQAVPDGYGNSYFWVKPERIVPVENVIAVEGRLDPSGAEVRPLDEDAVRAAGRWLRSQDMTAVGVCLLHSYADDSHERRVAELLREECPEVTVSLSSQVLREYREYERAMTTLVDAAVKPRVTSYLRDIIERLRAEPRLRPGAEQLAPDPATVPFAVMQSNGGVRSATEVQPSTTVLSGPAAGALGAARIARRAGLDRVLTLDGGGTSTDVCVVLDGEPGLTTEGTIGRYPVKVPMIDIGTVGAGGGSVAWISPESTLKVGPRSAGAIPGPLCYATGGTEVTVTDAHALLGRIPPHLLGGEMPLDLEAARSGVAKLAADTGLDPLSAAQGILEISAWNQANALRRITVQRGLDVRDFHLAAFGGSGALLLCRLIDILGLAGAVVPPDPGNVSAYGLLSVDVRSDHVRTAIRPHSEVTPEWLTGVVNELTEQATHALTVEGFAEHEHRCERGADLRYRGQAYEVRVPVPDGPLDTRAIECVAQDFHAAHRRRYGYDLASDPDQQVEWVNLRVAGIGPITHPEPPQLTQREGDVSRARRGTRPACFDAAAGFRETPVYWRGDLAPQDRIRGPAIVEEFGATLPLHPGFTAHVDRYGSVIVEEEK
ncbi:hydantoinase/oxoprolinase family protein [Lipingzhangella sp. LS1_29]|uniref:Hydantoinase/oxoprolinase family protein n=1 Tax=Lipingzhangella rawalii TaxID=2055835 RepID=A0ABU2H5G9_9ACTN|nr:hydantoinase/oxoprolinase family protein [Lipingzhangella rawalii]MDS1270547.1 hydantoinase/oxoprolinase family protein [Lipingzhangella rawalii]